MTGFKHSLILLAAMACTPPSGVTKGAGPTVTLADSLPIAEPDSFVTALAMRTQALTGSGDLLVENGTAILHFDSRGRLIHVMGRSGNGPGEFVRISTIVVLPGDSLVAAIDARRARIVIFGLSDGKLRREVVQRPRFFAGQQWRVEGDTLILPSKLTDHPFASWRPTTDSIWQWGSAPPIYTASINAYSQGGEPSIARFQDGWVALFPADGSLYVLRHDGTTLRTLSLPVRKRVGVPANLVAEVDRIAKDSVFTFVASLSMGISRLPDGRYVVVHLDADADPDPAPQVPGSGRDGNYSSVRYWVSLLSADLSRACVDGRIPRPMNEIILPVFRNDAVYLLSRAVDDDGHVHAVLYSYSVSDAGCDWQPLTRAPTP